MKGGLILCSNVTLKVVLQRNMLRLLMLRTVNRSTSHAPSFKIRFNHLMRLNK